jgi:predicted GH43/DUF377 family glycosyl hydrolase
MRPLAINFFRTRSLWIFLGITLLVFSRPIYKKAVKIQKKTKLFRGFTRTKDLYLGGVAVPTQLSQLLFADQLGIVVNVARLQIAGLSAYNPTLVQRKDGYTLFFRYDVLSEKAKFTPFSSRIGAVHLDEKFSVIEDSFKRVYFGSEYTEDPRVVSMNGNLYLFYNDLDQQNTKCRHMCVASLDPESLRVNYTVPLDVNLRFIEKNWSPFVYTDLSGKERLFFEYQICPRKIFELKNIQEGTLEDLKLPRSAAYVPLDWDTSWGEIHGGTPAQKVDNEYLSFFHSSFWDRHKILWFTMGAYTFEPNPPFRLTGISRHPILFKEIFNTPITHTAPKNKRVIFPGGFVVEKKEGRRFAHVVCGENDCGIKIVTIDIEKLKNNLTFIGNKE